MKFTFHFNNDEDQGRRAIGVILLASVVILAELIVLAILGVSLVTAIRGG